MSRVRSARSSSTRRIGELKRFGSRDLSPRRAGEAAVFQLCPCQFSIPSRFFPRTTRREPFKRILILNSVAAKRSAIVDPGRICFDGGSWCGYTQLLKMLSRPTRATTHAKFLCSYVTRARAANGVNPISWPETGGPVWTGGRTGMSPLRRPWETQSSVRWSCQGRGIGHLEGVSKAT